MKSHRKKCENKNIFCKSVKIVTESAGVGTMLVFYTSLYSVVTQLGVLFQEFCNCFSRILKKLFIYILIYYLFALSKIICLFFSKFHSFQQILIVFFHSHSTIYSKTFDLNHKLIKYFYNCCVKNIEISI